MSNRTSNERLALFREACADDRRLGEKDGLQAGREWVREAEDLYAVLALVSGEVGVEDLREKLDLDPDELLSRRIVPEVYQEGYWRSFVEGVKEVYREEILPALLEE